MAKTEQAQLDPTAERLKSDLENYLTTRLGGHTTIDQMRPLTGGACQDNYLVDVQVDGGQQGGRYALVFRSDKGGSLLGSLSRPEEYLVAEAAYEAGVKTPRPMWLEADSDYIGRPFYFMERIDGRATARYVVRDRELNAYRKQLPEDLARNLALIHSVKPADVSSDLIESLGKVPGAGGKDLALAAVALIREYLLGLGEPHPALELAANWLEGHAPATDEVVLVHGDFRTGNFMISPDGLHGIVDWEFAHWGDRHEDISWLCMRDWRFGKIQKEVGGFGDRESFYAAYEKASGAKVDPTAVRYWEIVGNVRWAVGSVQQADRHLSGKDRGIELAAIGRRTCEMEYEIMRLIENAG